MFGLPYLYTEAVLCLSVALLLAEENETQWGPAIGYFVVVKLRGALSLADEHVTKCRVTTQNDADRVENSLQLPTSCEWV